MFLSPAPLPFTTPPTILLPTLRIPKISTLRKPFPLHFIATQHKSPLFSLSGGGGGGGGGGSSNWWQQWRGGEDNDDNETDTNRVLWYLFLFSLSLQVRSGEALAIEKDNEIVVWEVKGGKRTKVKADNLRDVFVTEIVRGFRWPSLRRLVLPEGFPESVTSDYLEFSVWRGLQEVAAQVTGVLATQSLLYAVGLGKGAIPVAAAVNWVVRDGLGYLSKILLSKFGRHFDVHPKGWRLFADLMENASLGLEILTPAFPHLFVPIASAAGAGRSAASLIQAATGSCFYAGFAAQRNFAELIAKAEAQGMVSKSVGMMLGIALANRIQASTPLALVSFGMLTCVHMFCNMKAYQSVQLRTLNPYRASLVFGEYLVNGLIPSVKEVNDEEPFFPALPHLCLKPLSKSEHSGLSADSKDAAAAIGQRLRLGAKLSDVVKTERDTLALLDLYRHQGYIMINHDNTFHVIIKESCSPQDMLKSMFHVNYVYWLEKNLGMTPVSMIEDCRGGGMLRISLDYVEREFEHAKHDGELAGWITDSLIATPLPYRIRSFS